MLNFTTAASQAIKAERRVQAAKEDLARAQQILDEEERRAADRQHQLAEARVAALQVGSGLGPLLLSLGGWRGGSSLSASFVPLPPTLSPHLQAVGRSAEVDGGGAEAELSPSDPMHLDWSGSDRQSDAAGGSWWL